MSLHSGPTATRVRLSGIIEGKIPPQRCGPTAGPVDVLRLPTEFTAGKSFPLIERRHPGGVRQGLAAQEGQGGCRTHRCLSTSDDGFRCSSGRGQLCSAGLTCPESRAARRWGGSSVCARRETSHPPGMRAIPRVNDPPQLQLPSQSWRRWQSMHSYQPCTATKSHQMIRQVFSVSRRVS